MIVRPKMTPMQIYGLQLIKTGIILLKSGMKIKYKVLRAGDIANMVKKEFGDISNLLMDMKYYYTNLNTFKEIIGLDWTNQKKYVADRYDCDNFAFSFKSRVAEIWGINAVAVALGILEIDGDEGLHAWNYFIAEVDGRPQMFLLEPQLDLIQPVNVKTFKIEEHTVSYKPLMMFWY